ncbi:hypothetical protein PTTG_07099 [Puccinia triticina 1-1 BBBD Race 1]|uniref:Uncharacterized protein n=1 Tax=Puccinia triticina (isolate 1-1 / race 1 (BBBD)) TaxID=630390 RepID=A0A180G3F8_PUCT1|nr:hypothetical protein PTTG_07099 [Puccinia triticina 1-1 BBBD Race 1]
MTQLKILWEEAGGLLLQSSFTAPVGIDVKTFEFMVSQKLEATKDATFNDVMTVIQAASGKSQTKASQSLDDSYTPMDLDAVNAVRLMTGRYAPPHKRNSPHFGQQQKTGQNQQSALTANHPKPNLSIEKALAYRGYPLTNHLAGKWGICCHYCKQDVTGIKLCLFWEDVESGAIGPPPDGHNAPGSNYLPPERPFGKSN